MSNEIKKGSRITIKSINNTKKTHGLDPSGNMISMVGGTFKVIGIDGDRVYISKSPNSFTYSWNINDMYIVDEKEPDPIIFKFDETQLII
jgi:hypothetical protein